MKNKGGRPTDYTPEIADLICERLICGKDDKPESLNSICASEDMPNARTIYRWLLKNEEFCQKYTRAREVQQEARLEEIHEIADNSTDDIMYLTSEDNDGEGAKAVIKHSAIQRARLQIDTRKWSMARMAPKKYGDKIQTEVSGPNGGPVETINLKDVTLEQLEKARIAARAISEGNPKS